MNYYQTKTTGIAKAAAERQITELVHFTNVNNIESILEYGFLTRRELNNRGISYHYSDSNRLDGVLDSISLSVSFPNYEMFQTKRLRNSSARWCIFVFDANKVLEKNCLFFSHNAACSYFSNRYSRNTLAHFNEMFNESVSIKRRYYRAGLPEKYTTSPQAEILCCDSIPLSLIKCCIFSDTYQMNRFSALLKRKGINAVVDPSFFSSGPYGKSFEKVG